MLISTGNPLFPALDETTGNTQSYTLPSGLGDFTRVVSANQTPPTPPDGVYSGFPGPLPSGFGAATVSASASEALPIANNATGEQGRVSGVGFNQGTFLQSGATLPAGQQAAVSFTHLHAAFTNTNSSTFTALPGVAIDANGFVSQTPGSFVELAVQGTITINRPSNPFTIPFTMIAAQDKDNNQFTSVDPTGTIQLTTDDQGNFRVLGTDIFAQVGLNQNEGFSVDANLTLVSDPGSLIQLSSSIDVPGPLPNIGVFVGGSAVPEPSSLVVFGTGLLMLAGWGWRRDRRRKRQQLDTGENETSGYAL